MPFPAPTLPIVGPIIAAFAILLLSRWPRVQTLAGTAAALLLAIWITVLPLDRSASGQDSLFSGKTWLLAGRELLISEGLQDLFAILFSALALLYLLSLFFAQGSSFISASLAAFGFICAALMVQNFTFGAILLVLAAALLTMSYTPVIRHKTMGSLRYLLFFVLALGPLLLVGWLFESDQAALFSPLIVTMLAAAFAMLLAGFPFYIWVYPLVAEVPFLVPALILGLGQTAVITFIFSFLHDNPWLQANAQFQNWVAWSGTGTVLVAALLVLTAGQWRFLLGHLLLLNMGMGLLSLTLPMQAAGEIAILFHLSRFASLLLAGIAMSLLPRQGQVESIAGSHGLARRAPFTVALVAYAFFSLLGTPLTVGFPSQWTIITTFGQQSNLWLPLFLVLALGTSAYKILRVLATLIQKDFNDRDGQEPEWQRILAAAILIIAALLAFFPQPIISYVNELSAAIFGLR